MTRFLAAPGRPQPPRMLTRLLAALIVAGALAMRRSRAATLLKVWLEAVAKMVVQRDRPAETLPDVILRCQSARGGLRSTHDAAREQA